ncbi:MAG: hypothetical protein V4467_00280 [Patescibacteria group bacterium]
MLKEFLMKKMLQSKLKDVPKETQEKLLLMVEKNPDFFMKVAEEIKEKIKTGKSEMDAAMEVMTNHKAELENLQK